MVASILAIVGGLFKALVAILDWRRQQDLLDAGKAEANADFLKQQVEADAKALAAREAARDALIRSPGLGMSDDGFRRD